VLLLPSKLNEGFENNSIKQIKQIKQPMITPWMWGAAGQPNLSSTAGAADGSSNNQHLLENFLKTQDKLAEAFENRDAPVTSSATTTNEGNNVNIPVAGCNKDVCMQIDPKAVDPQGIPIAFQGNCINPKYKGSHYINYGIKYCPAFQSKYDVYDQECQTCGHYEYKGICRIKDPNKDPDPPGFVPTPDNPSNCDYETYESPDSVTAGPMPGSSNGVAAGPMPGSSNGGQNDLATSDPTPRCSTCKLIKRVDKCVLPECYSTDEYLPFPDDDDYRFAEGCFYHNPSKENTRPGMQRRPPGYYCPPITQGRSYDGGGNSGDPCYTNNGVLNYAKYVKMNTVCSNDKA